MTTPGAGASLEERLKIGLLEGRYVDQEGKPLGASETGGEFKRMPVRMLLLVDQRRISRLLVNCANSSMPVEVTKVALNPGKGAINLGGMTGGFVGSGEEGGRGMMSYPGATGMMGPVGPMMPSTDMFEEETYMGASEGMGSARRGEQQTSYDIPIEIQGIIYIFNPPDREKLGAGTAGEGLPAEPATSPAPAAPPPDDATSP
jgi:hypothetical protein